MKIQNGRIDVHHHIIPPAFTATMDAKGLDKVAGAQLPKWTPEITIDQMNMVGIQTAIVSLSAPGDWSSRGECIWFNQKSRYFQGVG